MSRRLMVTGATGFIGAPVIRLAQQRGWDVHAVSSRQAPGERDGVSWHRADLLDANAAATVVAEVQPSDLLHLAWEVRAGAWGGAGDHLRWLRASLALLESFADAGGHRVVMAGSCAEYDWTAGVCTEGLTPLAAATLYGTTKAALGTVLGAFSRDSGLSSAWARIFFAYGPGEHPNRLVASAIRSLLNGQPAACSHGRQRRDFLYVGDIADALLLLLESRVTGPVNIGSGEPLAVADLARRVGDLMGRPDLIALGARATVVEEPPLVVADVGRLRNEVGWAPRHSLDAGLSATIAWWRERCAREVCDAQ